MPPDPSTRPALNARAGVPGWGRLRLCILGVGWQEAQGSGKGVELHRPGCRLTVGEEVGSGDSQPGLGIGDPLVVAVQTETGNMDRGSGLGAQQAADTRIRIQ